MRFFKYTLGLAVMLALTTACDKDSLLFPTQVETPDVEGQTIIAGPSNMKLLGTYDLKFRVQWSGVSDRVAKAILRYEEASGKKEIVVTDFSKDLLIQAEKQGVYAFDVHYVAKDGTPSKTITRKVENKTYLVDYIGDNFELSKDFSRLRVIWANESSTPVTADVAYTTQGKTYSLHVENSTALQDTLETIALTAGKVDFNLRFKDGSGRESVVDTSFVMADQSYVTAAQKSKWIVVVSNQHSADYGASKLFDGITTGDNHWHTNWYPDPAKPETVFPHEVEITLEELIELQGLTLYNRTGGSNDGVKTFDVYVRRKFEDEYEKVASDLVQEMARGGKKSFSISTTKPVRMVKLVFKDAWPRSGVAGQYAHLAEIDVRGMVE